ncbi:unnamed protein product [Musa textilis]
MAAGILARQALQALRARQSVQAGQASLVLRNQWQAFSSHPASSKFKDDEEKEKLATEIAKEWSAVFERSINMLFLTEMVRGLMLTLKYFFEEESYNKLPFCEGSFEPPLSRRACSPSLCIACKLCEAVCF